MDKQKKIEVINEIKSGLVELAEASEKEAEEIAINFLENRLVYLRELASE